MSYELLRGLYLGAASNADTTSADARRLLHVRTELDALLPRLVNAGCDVVVTGNPGDGKSHLVRTLVDRGKLVGAEVELDLSAVDEAGVLARWRTARAASRPFVLCGNEGPLTSLLPRLRSDAALSEAGRELSQQLGRLVAAIPEELAARPTKTYLIDLADRSVLDPALIESALSAVCLPDFYPQLPRGRETSAGQNLMLLSSSPEAVSRLAALIAAAGRRCTDHIGFRHLWAAVSFAICAGKAPSTLQQELSRLENQLGVSPLDNLTRNHGQGALLKAFRELADPASWPSPQLDEDIWSNGGPVSGAWDVELEAQFEPPSALWSAGDRAGALDRFRSIKRMVALFHTAGRALVDAVASSGRDLPTSRSDEALLGDLLLGLRRLYVVGPEEDAAPPWLRAGLPLWVSHTYQDVPAADRPHVAVASIADADFLIRRARRPEWLENALGPPPDIVWLAHRQSGIALRVDPELYAQLRRAAGAAGPMAVPDVVQRFLSRLSGWEERASTGRADRMAVIDRPRGGLIAAAPIIQAASGLSYGSADAH